MSESKLSVHLKNHRRVDLTWSTGRGPEEVVRIIIDAGGFWMAEDRTFIPIAAITQIDLVSGDLRSDRGFAAAYASVTPIPAVAPIGIGMDNRFDLLDRHWLMFHKSSPHLGDGIGGPTNARLNLGGEH